MEKDGIAVKEKKWRPVLKQMLIAIFVSFLTFIVYPFLWLLFDFCVHHKEFVDDGSFGFGLGVMIVLGIGIFLPLNTLILMLLHWSRIFRYIIYSNLLVIIETILFMVILDLSDIVNRSFHYRLHDDCLMLILIVSMLVLAFLARLIFHRYYINYTHKYVDIYDKTHPIDRYAVNKEVDYVIMTALLSGALISVCVLLFC